jgi:hypothetical protein
MTSEYKIFNIFKTLSYIIISSNLYLYQVMQIVRIAS